MRSLGAAPLLDNAGVSLPVFRVSGEFVKQNQEKVIIENIGNADMKNLICRVEDAGGKGAVAVIGGDLAVERLEPDESISAIVKVNRKLTSSLRVFTTFETDVTKGSSTYDWEIDI